jgi:quercetin dioxygenase-like cupin family protein
MKWLIFAPAFLIAAFSSAPAQTPAVTMPATRAQMGSRAIDWNTLAVVPTKVGERRNVFDAPTATLTNFECHITTLNPGERPHPSHHHPDEELIVLREGALDVTISGRTQRVGPGAVIFFGSNEVHGLKNAGVTRATYYVFRFVTPLTPPTK